jgi:alpha-glucosidase
MKNYKWAARALMAALLAACLVLSWTVGAASGSAGTGEAIADGVARFVAPGVKFDELPPSLALEKPAQPQGPAPASWAPVPSFSVSDREYEVLLAIEPGTDLYGTGEIAGSFRRNGKVTQAWNSESPAYGARNPQLYQSHPWVLAVRADGTAFGLLADTTYRCRMDLRHGIRMTTQGHPFAAYVITGDTPQAVIKRLAGLIGTIAMPPRWALGYHQCRYSYYPDTRVKEIADEFRSRNLPADVIWMDIHYMNGYRIFTFDPARFPDPKGLNDYLHAKNFHAVWMIDPGAKKDPGYFVYDQGTAGNHWVLDKHGREFNGRVWPGMCAFPDFTRPETQAWWAGLYKDFLATGIDGVWNDMNEPSVFYRPNLTMPEDNQHRGGGPLPPGPHAQYHNVYGMLMVRSTREGFLQVHPDRRPFVLSRANYIGGQRYAAAWTGDNLATWTHLRYSTAMVMNWGLSGQPFAGPDIGGFTLPGTPQLFARWFGMGVFFPFARGHADSTNRNKEPWAFGPAIETSCRTALERRYRLLPYLYTLFREAATSGLPVMRPVFFADPKDPALREESEAFLVGPDLLIVPDLHIAQLKKPALPQGTWREITLVGEDPKQDINQPVLKLRAGAILPLGKVVQSTAEESLDPLTLMVSLDERGEAEGRLYEDAGDGWAFQKGDYLLTTYRARTEGGKVIVSIANSEGSRPRPARQVMVEVVTDSGVIKAQGTEAAGIVIEKGK